MDNKFIKKNCSPLYTDAFHLFAKKKKKNKKKNKQQKLKTLIQIITYSPNIETEFGREKCGTVTINDGKRKATKRKELPNQENNTKHGERGNNKYL